MNNITGCKWDETTPTNPSEGKTWECDACASAVVMTNVTPEVLPGSDEETYVDIDDHSADFAYVPEQDEDPTPVKPAFELDADGIMRVGVPIKIVCVGNSITEGVGASSQSMAWPGQLNRLLGDGYRVVNRGVSGTTMGRTTDAPYWNTGWFTTAKEDNPDILFIALGTNDAFTYRWNQWGDTFKQDYLAMIEEFRANGRNPVLFLVLPPPMFPTSTSEHNTIIEQHIMPIIREVAAETGAYIVDFHTSMKSKAALWPDNLHPNDEGAGLLAQIAYNRIKETQVLKGTVAVNGAAVEGTQAVVPAGGAVTLSPESGSEGSWSWTGPKNFTSTERKVTLEDVQTGGTYTVQFTDAKGQRSVLTFLVSVQGQNGGTIKPYIRTSEGQWQQTLNFTARPGQTINFGPQYSASGTVTWSWRGPNGFFYGDREPSVRAMTKTKAGAYGVTVTDAKGRQTTAVFNIRVEGDLDCETLIPYINAGSWEKSEKATVAAGTNVTFGPQPTDGEWTWTGPNGYTYNGREARINNFNASKAGDYIATRTNEAGCYDQIVFTLTLK